MVAFWFDSDSLVTPNRGAYRFSILPQFWDFLEQKAQEHLFASSKYVYDELVGNEHPDDLEKWAKKVNTSFFLDPDESVQKAYAQIAELVVHEPRWKAHHVSKFLEDADPWIIAHAKALGGRVVTFEKSSPQSAKPFIPDVAVKIDVKCICLWDVLSELKVTF
jgi:hypothetical protein